MFCWLGARPQLQKGGLKVGVVSDDVNNEDEEQEKNA